jgi:uncharacterized protein YndB with AHSA1/START domain
MVPLSGRLSIETRSGSVGRGRIGIIEIWHECPECVESAANLRSRTGPMSFQCLALERKDRTMSFTEGTVDLTEDFGQPVDAVFAAWSEENAQRAWGDPGEGWKMSFDRFRFTVGETDVCRFGPTGGQQYINENRYLEIESGKRIVYSTSLSSNGRLTFAGTVAITFEEVGDGTRMRLVEQGLYFNGHDDVAGHRSGWASMLGALGKYLRSERS